MDMDAPRDSELDCHLALCAGQILNAVVVGNETGDADTFNARAAMHAISEPCEHHIIAALMLLDANHMIRNVSPSQVYEMIPAFVAAFWSGDARC